jgi:hypothetical protein
MDIVNQCFLYWLLASKFLVTVSVNSLEALNNPPLRNVHATGNFSITYPESRRLPVNVLGLNRRALGPLIN